MVDCLQSYIIPLAVPVISVVLTSISTFIILRNSEFQQWYAQPFIAKKLEAFIDLNQIYCLSDRFLETCIEEIGEKELIEYIKGC